MSRMLPTLLIALVSVTSITNAQAINHYNAELDNQLQLNQNQYPSRYQSVAAAVAQAEPSAPQQQLQRAGVDSGITEDSVPAWAQDDDVCKTVKQCEDCNVGANAYCRWTIAGESQCCTSSVSLVAPAVDAIVQLPAHASVTSAIDTPEYPAWADLQNDVCVTKRSCDLCLSESQYCRYTESGRSKCCSSRETQQVVAEAVAPHLHAGVTSAINMELPAWARPEVDICLELSTCDSCHVGDNSYCHYTEDAKAHCCVKSPAL